MLTGFGRGKLGHRSTVMAADEARDISGLLEAWGRGDLAARDQLMPVVYEDLRRRARAYLQREGAGHMLQPTALVHETYLRLIRQHMAWQNRAQFYGVAAQMMRRILVDHARGRKMAKRSGQWARVPIGDVAPAERPPDVDVLDLHTALDELATFDSRKSKVAELRFFGGLSLEETGDVLQISLATVEREWQAARAWLYSRLKGPRDDA